MQEVTLKIAPPYDAGDIEKIRLGFERLLGHPVKLTIQDDESLIGGFFAFADGKIYDASMKTKLFEMRQRMSE